MVPLSGSNQGQVVWAAHSKHCFKFITGQASTLISLPLNSFCVMAYDIRHGELQFSVSSATLIQLSKKGARRGIPAQQTCVFITPAHGDSKNYVTNIIPVYNSESLKYSLRDWRLFFKVDWHVWLCTLHWWHLLDNRRQKAGGTAVRTQSTEEIFMPQGKIQPFFDFELVRGCFVFGCFFFTIAVVDWFQKYSPWRVKLWSLRSLLSNTNKDCIL